MKPRKRAQQKQSSRLWLRNKDHRDAILDDAYVNIMYAEQIPHPDDEDNKQTGIFWKRYPRLYFMSGFSVFEQYFGYHQYKFTVDVDRQFVYDDGEGLFGEEGNVTGYLAKMKDIWLAGSSYSGASFNVYKTDDGIEFNKELNVSISGQRYGNNGLIAFNVVGGAGALTDYNIRYFDTDEDGHLILDHSISTQKAFEWNVYYLGALNDGALFISVDQYNPEGMAYIYKITGDGSVEHNLNIEVIEEIIGSHINGVHSVHWCRKGSFLSVAIFYNTRESLYSPNRTYQVAMWSTSDNGNTIHKQGFIQLVLQQGSGAITDCMRTNLVERNGYFYFYGMPLGGRLYAWKSTDGITWIELNLPDYLDVPTITEGNFVSQIVPEYYRIILNPEVAEGESNEVSAWNLIDSREIFGFKDGEHITKNDMTNEEYLYLLASNIHFYLDNMIFLPSEKNFAFKVSTANVQVQTPDYLMEGDYCYRGTTPVPPFWNPYTHYYIGDKVSYGTIWKCISACKGIPPSEGTYWTQIQQ